VRFFTSSLLLSVCLCFSNLLLGQDLIDLQLVVHHHDEPIVSATVELKSERLSKGGLTAADGTIYLEKLPFGSYELSIRFVGFISHKQQIILDENSPQPYRLPIELKHDILEMEQTVVTATRSEVPIYNTPIITNRISKKTFEATQAISLSEGLNFSPGLRVENNCQNCGFTQLRMNGLDGPYSQVLINSRPVFSALAGVYGLELIPATMVERIEVVKGGGSVLYGGNAIAGTVNIITKEPIDNTFNIGFNQSFTDAAEPDRTASFNGSLISKDYTKGLSFYGFNRARDPWDANGDSFSELTQLRNTTIGADGFWNPTRFSKAKLNVYGISEFRRGGNGFDLLPHQTDITEQLDHQIVGLNSSFEQFSTNFKHKAALYISSQLTNRKSYYGGGGRVVPDGESFTESDLNALNAYGASDDLAASAGLQYTYEPGSSWLLTTGAEFQFNRVEDAMPGYNRSINQDVGTLGNYLQMQWMPTEKLTLVTGGRLDFIQIDGNYDLQEERFENDIKETVFVPRLSAMYDISSDWKARLSFAQGYRAPQAFDEDLHINMVGGNPVFIQLGNDLSIERSNSVTASLNWNRVQGNFQSNVVIEAFYTALNNPFILSNQQQLDNGIAVITKRNSDGAYVQGFNLEANVAFSRKTILQLGGTIQQARFNEEELIWKAENSDDIRENTTTNKLLRTPDLYGFMSLVHNPIKALQLSYSSVLTGPMNVAHVIDVSDEYTVVKRTPVFWEHNLKMTYTTKNTAVPLELFTGIQNIFNAFQSDFDRGIDRDAGYVYGPNRPRTLFGGMKVLF
jgi:outer membrane receptor for ferrienterochelin and colicins